MYRVFIEFRLDLEEGHPIDLLCTYSLVEQIFVKSMVILATYNLMGNSKPFFGYKTKIMSQATFIALMFIFRIMLLTLPRLF